LNLGATFGVPILLVAKSGVVSPARLCFYASKPMAQPSSLVEAVASAALFASQPTTPENNGRADASWTNASAGNGNDRTGHATASATTHTNQQTPNAVDTISAIPQVVGGGREHEGHLAVDALPSSLGASPLESDQSPFPSWSNYANSYDAPLPRSDYEVNYFKISSGSNPAICDNDVLRRSALLLPKALPPSSFGNISSRTSQSGSENKSHLADRSSEERALDGMAVGAFASTGNSVAGAIITDSTETTVFPEQSPLLPLHASELGGDRNEVKEQDSDSNEIHHSSINVQSSSSKHLGLQSSNYTTNPFSPMNDAQVYHQEQNTTCGNPHAYPNGYPYHGYPHHGYPQHGYLHGSPFGHPPTYLPPYLPFNPYPEAAGALRPNDTPISSLAAPPPNLIGNSPLHKPLEPAWPAEPPYNGEDFQQGLQYHAVPKEIPQESPQESFMASVPLYHAVSVVEATSTTSRETSKGQLPRTHALESKNPENFIVVSDNSDSSSTSSRNSHWTLENNGSSSSCSFHGFS
jgi:hypothetical protein